MKYSFYMPARIVGGKGIVSSFDGYSSYGNKCLIVSGKNLYKRSSVITDLEKGLTDCGVRYKTFFEIENNPSYETVCRAVTQAREFGADFIVGVGGGSSMDAAKATALLCANGQVTEKNLFTPSDYVNKPLPLVLIGTTSGTGSEVTSASVLTFKNENGIVKKTVKSPESYASCVLCDSSYTQTLSDRITVSTALDAVCHAIEAFYSKKSGYFGRMYAEKALPTMISSLKKFDSGDRSEELREMLYVGSLYAGLAINDGGTSFGHSLGYQLTNYLGYEHGFACASLMRAFLSNASDSDSLFKNSGLTVAEVENFITEQLRKFVPDTKITHSDAEKFAEIGLTMPSLNNHVFAPLDKKSCEEIYLSI